MTVLPDWFAPHERAAHDLVIGEIVRRRTELSRAKLTIRSEKIRRWKSTGFDSSLVLHVAKNGETIMSFDFDLFRDSEQMSTLAEVRERTSRKLVETLEIVGQS